MSETIQHMLNGMKSTVAKINERLDRIAEIYYEVFDNDLDHALLGEGEGSPIAAWHDGTFHVNVEDGTVDGVPAILLDRSDDDFRAMWQVVKYDASISLCGKMIEEDDRLIDYYTNKPGTDLQDNRFLEVKKNTAKRKEYMKEATAERAKIMDSVKDADALSQYLSVPRYTHR